MNSSTIYIFDFCGTIINKKTHLMIKWYCLIHFKVKFFKKYLTKYNSGIGYDIAFIKNHLNIISLAKFISQYSKETELFSLNKHLLTKFDSTIILTAAMDDLVKEILIIKGINISKNKLIGSNKNIIIDGNVKKLIVEKLIKQNPGKKFTFFTDSWDDQPVFNIVDKVIFSELLDHKCKTLINTHSKYNLIK